MHQCRTFFPLPDLVQEDLSTTHVGVALEASLACFKRVRNPYYQNDDGAFLDVRHAAMYCSFLYRLSFACRGSVWAEPLYNLNRTLHGCDLFCEVRLPTLFLMDHPVGTVLGRATYADYLEFQQGCTVGNNHGRYPRFTGPARLLTGALVAGDVLIGENVVFAAGCTVIDEHVPSNSIVFGHSPQLTIKRSTTDSYWRDSGFRMPAEF